MTGQPFEVALAESLAALERGERLDFVLLRYPRHAEALRPALELRTTLSQRVLPIPAPARARGEQRLRAELAAPPQRGFGFISRAAVQALLGVAILSGAVGASATAGGPNLPFEVLHAVGLLDRADEPRESEGDPSAQATRSATETPTTPALVDSTTPTPDPTAVISATAPAAQPLGFAELSGLCKAFLLEGLGRPGLGNPTTLARLLRAANADAVIDDDARARAIVAFCATIRALPSALPATPTPAAVAPPAPGPRP